MFYIGIDPGQSGAIVALDEQGGFRDSLSFSVSEGAPDLEWLFNLRRFLRSFDPVEVKIYVEKVHAMPKQGVVSMFSFGTNFGSIQGMLLGMGFSFELVTPRVWQKLCWDPGFENKNLALYKLASKEKSRITCKNKWGSKQFMRTARTKVMDSGLVDASLIALYSLKFYEAKKEAVVFEETVMAKEEQVKARRAELERKNSKKRRQLNVMTASAQLEQPD